MGEHNHGSLVGRKLLLSVMLSLVILGAEIVGGIISHSLALLSDAGHVLIDVLALGLSWFGVRQAERPASSKWTFGYHRVGVIIAIVNAFSIFSISGVILYEAYRRWQQPPEVNSTIMLIIAVIGLAVNVFVAFWLRGEQKNLNVRSAFWHVLGDALASVGVIGGAVIIMVTGIFVIDPILSAIIGLIIVVSGWGIFREGMRVLLEIAPSQIDVDKMVDTLQQIPGVRGVHDIHVWRVTPALHAMSGHVLIGDVPISQAAGIQHEVEQVLRQQFDIEHSTLQFECQECGKNDLYCTLQPDQHGDHRKTCKPEPK